MTGAQVLFWIFAVASCGGALAVVISQNIVRMAFWLAVSLGSVAGFFFLLGADFVAATQLLIYVGGTVVLLVFGVMLTASGPYVRMKTSPADGFLAAVVGVLLLSVIVATVGSVNWDEAFTRVDPQFAAADPQKGYNKEVEGNTVRPIGLALLGARPDKDLAQPMDDENNNSEDRKLSTGYLLPFEIVSIHLLVVLIGAAYLARAKRRVDPGEGERGP